MNCSTQSFDCQERRSIRPIAGHVGDGNFHVFVIVDPKNPDDIRRVHEYSLGLAKWVKLVEIGYATLDSSV